LRAKSASDHVTGIATLTRYLAGRMCAMAEHPYRAGTHRP
jgi:hypothetical protein